MHKYLYIKGGTKERMFLKWVVVGRVKVGDLPTPPENSTEGSVSVAMQQWNVEQRVFAVEQFFRNNDSVVTVRLFRRHFNVARDGAIPDRSTILRWVESFRTTGSVMKRTSTVRPRMARTPENVESVRRSVIESPRHSTIR